MFKVAITPVYEFEVRGEIPGGIQFSFTATFHRLTPAQSDELLASRATDADIARRVLANWTAVVDDNEVPIPFSSDALERLLAIQGVAAGIVDSWHRSLRGAREKN